MNYSEVYELRERMGLSRWVVLDTYEREHEAFEAMERISAGKPGVWRVVRVSEVTVGSVVRA